jgi:hypothetical protein
MHTCNAASLSEFAILKEKAGAIGVLDFHGSLGCSGDAGFFSMLHLIKIGGVCQFASGQVILAHELEQLVPMGAAPALVPLACFVLQGLLAPAMVYF